MRYGSDYSNFYDKIYQEKDYKGEIDFVLERVSRLKTLGGRLTVLDLGCGTGRHMIELVRQGHDVHGVDLSSSMLNVAASRFEVLEAGATGVASFQEGDIRDVEVGRSFGLIVCLFHVLGYLRERDDFLTAFANARRHVEPDGLFLFDFWQDAAVLADPPERRERMISTKSHDVRRVSTPHWDRDNCRVQIDYTIEARNRMTGELRVEHEHHSVRYLSTGEATEWLLESGFDVLEIGEWMTASTPTEKSFSTYIIARPSPPGARSSAHLPGVLKA